LQAGQALALGDGDQQLTALILADAVGLNFLGDQVWVPGIGGPGRLPE
jgi:hypothetical protein